MVGVWRRSFCIEHVCRSGGGGGSGGAGVGYVVYGRGLKHRYLVYEYVLAGVWGF